jgi:hypothetical protein
MGNDGPVVGPGARTGDSEMVNLYTGARLRREITFVSPWRCGPTRRDIVGARVVLERRIGYGALDGSYASCFRYS